MTAKVGIVEQEDSVNAKQGHDKHVYKAAYTEYAVLPCGSSWQRRCRHVSAATSQFATLNNTRIDVLMLSAHEGI
jgi:predicted transcriptional regulator